MPFINELHQIYLNKNVDKKMTTDFYENYIKDELNTDILPEEILEDIEYTVLKLQEMASYQCPMTEIFPNH